MCLVNIAEWGGLADLARECLNSLYETTNCSTIPTVPSQSPEVRYLIVVELGGEPTSAALA